MSLLPKLFTPDDRKTSKIDVLRYIDLNKWNKNVKNVSILKPTTILPNKSKASNRTFHYYYQSSLQNNLKIINKTWTIFAWKSLEAQFPPSHTKKNNQKTFLIIQEKRTFLVNCTGIKVLDYTLWIFPGMYAFVFIPWGIFQ